MLELSLELYVHTQRDALHIHRQALVCGFLPQRVVCRLQRLAWAQRSRAQHDDAPAVVVVILFRSGAQTNALRHSDVLAPTPTTAPVLQLAVNCCCGGAFLLQAEVLASDCMRLPYRSGVFDAAISIAVLHHFSSEVRVCVCFP